MSSNLWGVYRVRGMFLVRSSCFDVLLCEIIRSRIGPSLTALYVSLVFDQFWLLVYVPLTNPLPLSRCQVGGERG